MFFFGLLACEGLFCLGGGETYAGTGPGRVRCVWVDDGDGLEARRIVGCDRWRVDGWCVSIGRLDWWSLVVMTDAGSFIYLSLGSGIGDWLFAYDPAFDFAEHDARGE